MARAACLDRRISPLVADDDTDDVRGRASARLRLVCACTSRPRTAQPPLPAPGATGGDRRRCLVCSRDAAAPGSRRHLQLLCRLPAVRAARLLERTFDLRRHRNRGRRGPRSQSGGGRRASALRCKPRAPRPSALLHVRTRRLARTCLRDRRGDPHRPAATSTRDHASGGGALACARRVAGIRVAESDHAVLSARRRIAGGQPTCLDDCPPRGRLRLCHRGLHAPCTPSHRRTWCPACLRNCTRPCPRELCRCRDRRLRRPFRVSPTCARLDQAGLADHERRSDEPLVQPLVQWPARYVGVGSRRLSGACRARLRRGDVRAVVARGSERRAARFETHTVCTSRPSRSWDHSVWPRSWR